MLITQVADACRGSWRRRFWPRVWKVLASGDHSADGRLRSPYAPPCAWGSVVQRVGDTGGGLSPRGDGWESPGSALPRCPPVLGAKGSGQGCAAPPPAAAAPYPEPACVAEDEKGIIYSGIKKSNVNRPYFLSCQSTCKIPFGPSTLLTCESCW